MRPELNLTFPSKFLLFNLNNLIFLANLYAISLSTLYDFSYKKFLRRLSYTSPYRTTIHKLSNKLKSSRSVIAISMWITVFEFTFVYKLVCY